jgi:hypothetical protein
MVDAWIIFYVGSGLELKHMGCPVDFYWGGRGWRALPKSHECFKLKILAVSTAALPQ